jgi:hypothetical protein
LAVINNPTLGMIQAPVARLLSVTSNVAGVPLAALT